MFGISLLIGGVIGAVSASGAAVLIDQKRQEDEALLQAGDQGGDAADPSKTGTGACANVRKWLLLHGGVSTPWSWAHGFNSFPPSRDEQEDSVLFLARQGLQNLGGKIVSRAPLVGE
jgi:hypothetical protein